MKHKIEKLIGQMSLVKPTTGLDQRCEEILEQSAEVHVPVAGAVETISMGGVVMAGLAAICLTLGFVTGLRMGNDAVPPTALTDRGDLAGARRPDPNRDWEIAGLTDQPSTVQLVDRGVFLLNGRQPVRTFNAMTVRKVQLRETNSGQSVEIVIPVRRTVIAPTPGA